MAGRTRLTVRPGTADPRRRHGDRRRAGAPVRRLARGGARRGDVRRWQRRCSPGRGRTRSPCWSWRVAPTWGPSGSARSSRFRKPLETTRRRTDLPGLATQISRLPHGGPSSPGHAADRIVELARSRPTEVTLVTLGPLTNLAVGALDREPALPNLLCGYVLIGSACRGPGNTTPTTEWNLHVDPDAAKGRVFEAWAAARDSGRGTPPGDGARRDRGGAAPAGAPRPARPPCRRGCSVTPARSRVGATAGHRVGGGQSDAPVHRRCRALLLRVPRSI